MEDGKRKTIFVLNEIITIAHLLNVDIAILKLFMYVHDNASVLHSLYFAYLFTYSAGTIVQLIYLLFTCRTCTFVHCAHSYVLYRNSDNNNNISGSMTVMYVTFIVFYRVCVTNNVTNNETFPVFFRVIENNR